MHRRVNSAGTSARIRGKSRRSPPSISIHSRVGVRDASYSEGVVGVVGSGGGGSLSAANTQSSEYTLGYHTATPLGDRVDQPALARATSLPDKPYPSTGNQDNYPQNLRTPASTNSSSGNSATVRYNKSMSVVMGRNGASADRTSTSTSSGASTSTATKAADYVGIQSSSTEYGRQIRSVQDHTPGTTHY